VSQFIFYVQVKSERLKVVLICRYLKAVGSLVQKQVGGKRNSDQVREYSCTSYSIYFAWILWAFKIKIIFLFEGLSQSCYQIQNLMWIMHLDVWREVCFILQQS